MLQMAGVAAKKEIAAVSRELVLDKKLVKNVLWLSALFEQISKIKATEVVNYETMTDMVCRAPPGITERLQSSVFWAILLFAAFVGGWFAKACCGSRSPKPAEKPKITKPAPVPGIVRRTVRTQSQTTYHLKWATPRFGVLAQGDQGAWPESFELG